MLSVWVTITSRRVQTWYPRLTSRIVCTRRLLEEQIVQHQKRKQVELIGIIEPNEMALNVGLFKQAGFLPKDAVTPQRGIRKRK